MMEVWSQYQSKDSTFKVYEEPIRNFPIFTFCTDPDSNYMYEFDFIIYYDNTKLKFGRNQIDNGDNSTETIYLEDVYTYLSGTCYQIFIKINYTIESGVMSEIYIEFNETISYDNLPEVLQFYLTSDENSHGIVFNEWKDGEELAITINMVCNKLQ